MRRNNAKLKKEKKIDLDIQLFSPLTYTRQYLYHLYEDEIQREREELEYSFVDNVIREALKEYIQGNV